MATESNNLKQGDHKFHGRSLMFAKSKKTEAKNKGKCSEILTFHTLPQSADHHFKVP